MKKLKMFTAAALGVGMLISVFACFGCTAFGSGQLALGTQEAGATGAQAEQTQALGAEATSAAVSEPAADATAEPTEEPTEEATEEPTPELKPVPTPEPTPEPKPEHEGFASIMRGVIDATGFETMSAAQKACCIGAAGRLDGRRFLAYLYPAEGGVKLAFWKRTEDGRITCLLDEEFEYDYAGVSEPLKGDSFFISRNYNGEWMLETVFRDDNTYVSWFYALGDELTLRGELVSQNVGGVESYTVNGQKTDQSGYYAEFNALCGDEYYYEVMLRDEDGEPLGDDFALLLRALQNDEEAYLSEASEDEKAEAFFEGYVKKYGRASGKEFVSCSGTNVKPYPASAAGLITAVQYDIDGDNVKEIIALRVDKSGSGAGPVLAELFALEGGNYKLKASCTVCGMDYCEASFIYLYKHPVQRRFFIITDTEGYGAYTGFGYISASAFEVTDSSITEAGMWEEVFGYVQTDIEGGLASIYAPFAKYCADYDYSAGFECFLPLCEIVHTVAGRDSGYTDTVHKLAIVPFEE